MITKKGKIVKNSGEKTIKVEVRSSRLHDKYKKKFLVTKNFLVHDPKSEGKVGDEVIIQQCAPVSKNKSWEISSINKAA
jgi:small subunit ribosomal protein S17